MVLYIYIYIYIYRCETECLKYEDDVKEMKESHREA
jgi:hypothetical protein